ncbi:MAG: lysylphosphatidylglycerol synthase transmembrane domain-containing protein [Solirubrobacteraceae bacterium]
MAVALLEALDVELRRRSILVRSGAVFWLTSAVNALAMLVGASLLLLGIGHGLTNFARAWLPLLITAPLATLIAASPWLVAGHPSLRSRGWIAALVDGVDDAWRAARRPNWRLIGALSYLGLDMAVLLCLFRGLGYHANVGALMLAYLVGYTATLIPIPAGIGVLEGGIGGALVLYRAPPAATVAALLLYHAIAFWIPSLGGWGAYAGLVIHSRHERSTHAAQANRPDSPRGRRRGLRQPGTCRSAALRAPIDRTTTRIERLRWSGPGGRASRYTRGWNVRRGLPRWQPDDGRAFRAFRNAGAV